MGHMGPIDGTDVCATAVDGCAGQSRD